MADQLTAWSPVESDGRFRRKESEFRDWIEADADARFPAESDRYHLYVQYACPWAHRTLLARRLLGLEEAITVDVVDWRMRPDGTWVFNPDEPGSTRDSQNGFQGLQEVYRKADPGFGAKGTVPVLWDKKQETVVNNESREIVHMLDTVLAPRFGNGETLLPEGLEKDVDAMIDANYEPINNGVYKCGFARTQEAFDDAYETLFRRLKEVDEHLRDREWLVGDGQGVLTEADICLWPTLLRFDPVYHTHFKCNKARIRDHPDLWAFTKRLHNLPSVADTVNLHHIRNHYYWSHTSINPHRIVPEGPDMQELQE